MFQTIALLLSSLLGAVSLADVLVVSATPDEALRREWKEHDIAEYVKLICGQEMGSKKEHLKYGAGGKYDADKVLMIVDFPTPDEPRSATV